MAEVLVFPDSVDAVLDLIDSKVFAGKQVRAGTYLPLTSFDSEPFALVIGEGGPPGYVDQVERVRIQIYGPYNDPLDIAKSMRAQLVGDNIDTPAGFIDNIKADQVPTQIPYHETVSMATLMLSVTSRPIL
ncbi:hypothetical protein [Glutamicibacter nicotianae]|uniref:hypothetical protein n=1 Tax=Glutamicibacter nicotianae TaxID=37929 RepID=UPI00167F59CA|nr:hypothetical protein [Glutamicibacter nicotianae]